MSEAGGGKVRGESPFGQRPADITSSLWLMQRQSLTYLSRSSLVAGIERDRASCSVSSETKTTAHLLHVQVPVTVKVKCVIPL